MIGYRTVIARRGIVTAIAGAAFLGGASAWAQEVSFSDKVVRVVINLGVASGLSAHHQLFVPFVSKHLPGNPKIIVETKPGGRGVLGAAYMAKSVKPDGLTIATFAILTGTVSTGDKLPVDLTKFVYAGSTGQGTVVYVREDTGIKSVSDLSNPPSQLLIATTAPNASIHLQYRLFLHAIGAKGKFKVLSGYRGMLGTLQAIRSGEANTGLAHAGVYMARLDSIRKDRILGLMELGLPTADGRTVPTSGLGVPTVIDTWKKLAPGTVDSDLMKAFQVIQIAKAASWVHVLPPGTPDRVRRVWEKAFAAAMTDPEYVGLLRKRNAPVALFTDSKTTERMIADILEQSQRPAIKAAIAEVALKK